MHKESKMIAKFHLPRESVNYTLNPSIKAVCHLPESIFSLTKAYKEGMIVVFFNESRILFGHSGKEEILSFRSKIEQKMNVTNLFDSNIYQSFSGSCYFDHNCLKCKVCFKNGSFLMKIKESEDKKTFRNNIPKKIVNKGIKKRGKKGFKPKEESNEELAKELFEIRKVEPEELFPNIEGNFKFKKEKEKREESVFYYKTKMTWNEARKTFLEFSKGSLTFFLHQKKSPLFLDNFFNLFSKRPLKTKEKKKSRLGININILRESFRLI